MKILPQHGSVSAPFFASYRGLLLPGTEAPSAVDSAALWTPHPADRFLKTTCDEATSATHQLAPHQVIAALAGGKFSDWCEVDPDKGFAKLVFRDKSLAIRLDVTPSATQTTEYTIETNTAGLRDFIWASLAHYSGVPATLLDNVPDFATATGDDLFLAAGLIYHQQFIIGDRQAFPATSVFQNLAKAPDISAQLSGGQDGEIVFVPSQKGDATNPVEIQRLTDGRVVIKIFNTCDFGKPGMPLFGNVLVLSAVALMPEKRTMPFPDFLSYQPGVG